MKTTEFPEPIFSISSFNNQLFFEQRHERDTVLLEDRGFRGPCGEGELASRTGHHGFTRG